MLNFDVEKNSIFVDDATFLKLWKVVLYAIGELFFEVSLGGLTR